MARSGAPSARRKLETSKIDESRRLSTSAITAPPLEVEIGGRDYLIASDIDIDVIEQMLAIEEIVDDTSTDREVLDALIAGRNLVRALLEESNENVPERLPLKAGDLLAIFNFLMGGRKVAEEVIATLAEADLWGAEDEETGEAAEGVAQPEGELDEEAETAPLASRSAEHSSGSDESTTGRRTGGKASRGESSSSTSQKKKQAAA
jgi:hypothetical protein